MNLNFKISTLLFGDRQVLVEASHWNHQNICAIPSWHPWHDFSTVGSQTSPKVVSAEQGCHRLDLLASQPDGRRRFPPGTGVAGFSYAHYKAWALFHLWSRGSAQKAQKYELCPCAHVVHDYQLQVWAELLPLQVHGSSSPCLLPPSLTLGRSGRVPGLCQVEDLSNHMTVILAADSDWPTLKLYWIYIIHKY